MATSPCHCTSTTVMRASGRIPLTVAPLVSCSSRAIAHACPFLIDLIWYLLLYDISAMHQKHAEALETASRENEAVNSCRLLKQRGCVREGNGAHMFTFVE